MDSKRIDLRLECLKLASHLHREYAQVLETAKKYEQFVLEHEPVLEKVEEKPAAKAAVKTQPRKNEGNPSSLF